MLIKISPDKIAPRENAPGGPPRWSSIAKTGVGTALENNEDTRMARHLVSPDALALVRFGLRAADDPRILGTIKVIDSLLKVETPTGPSWHRYNDEGYGEHPNGDPLDGTGVGRAWPLFKGERAHYELLAHQGETAKRLLNTMESFANEGALISEQIWDSPDLGKRGLFLGKPSGSAMPWVWAHAEYIKLRRSLPDGREIKFTFRRPEAGHWEGVDFSVRIAAWRRDYTGSLESSATNGN
jgi:glucoamylase